jgi:hypothetical protein
MESNTVTKITSNEENLELLCGDDESFRLPLRRNGFDSDADLTKFIKNCEKLIRQSTEYREWKKYIVEVLGVASCAITEEKNYEVTIDIHHHPVSLFVLVKAITSAKIDKAVEFCTFDICQEAIDLHFTNKVGFIPLVRSMHEKYHGGYLEIPIDLCTGEYSHIISNYPLDEDELTHIMSLTCIQSADLKTGWKRDSYPGIKLEESKE